MADKIIKIDMQFIEAGDCTGKIVNIYDTYAHALAHGATGLVTVKAVDPLTGVVGSAIPQTAKTAGPTIDNKGKLLIALDNAAVGAVYWAACVAGRMGGPMKILVTPEDWTPFS